MTSVVMQLRVDGVHRFPDAPAEVNFLSFLHRHEFHIRVEVEVFHNDRDIEIIMAKHEMQKYFEDHYPKFAHESKTINFDTKSCEDLAEELIMFLKGYFAGEADEFGRARVMSVEVLEDGENGAILRESL